MATTAKDIMTKEVITIKADTPIRDIARLLSKNNIAGVPVVDDENHVVGIVSEADIVVKIARPHLPAHIQLLGGIIYLERMQDVMDELKKITAYCAKDIMTTKVVTITEDASIEDVATLMVDERVNRVPVIKDKKITGIITRSDLVKTMTQNGSDQ